MFESIKEIFYNFKKKNPIIFIYIIYVIICTILALVIYFALDADKLTYIQYLEIIKNHGIDISDEKKAINEADTIIKKLKYALEKEYIDAYNNAPPCGFCLGYRSYYRCCESKRTSYASNKRSTYYSKLTEQEKILLKAYNNYNNLKLYDIIKGYLFMVVLLPLILGTASLGLYY